MVNHHSSLLCETYSICINKYSLFMRSIKFESFTTVFFNEKPSIYVLVYLCVIYVLYLCTEEA